MSGKPSVTGDAHKKQFPDGLYPRQKDFTYVSQDQPQHPSAPDDVEK